MKRNLTDAEDINFEIGNYQIVCVQNSEGFGSLQWRCVTTFGQYQDTTIRTEGPENYRCESAMSGMRTFGIEVS